MAQEAEPAKAKATPQVKIIYKTIYKTKIVYRDRPSKVVKAGPVYKGAPAVAPAPIQACSQASAYALNKTYGIKGWIIPANNFGDSILLDYGCWRTELAKYGFGLIGNMSSTFRSNMINHYTPTTKEQQYAGQRPTGNVNTAFYLTYDLSRWGLPDGQFEIAGNTQNVSYLGNYGFNALTMSELKLYGTAFNKAVEYEVGYINTYLRFQAAFIGGNVTNPLGASGGIAALVGGNLTPKPTPAVVVKWHITDKWYDTFAIQRSNPGGVATLNSQGNTIAIEHFTNPSSFNFTNNHPCETRSTGTLICYNSPRELFINEIGYKSDATPGNLSTWVRLTGYYNTTHYNDLTFTGTTGTGTRDSNYAISLYADQQLLQFQPGSPQTAYQGLYIGGTVGRNDPKAAALEQTYEARAYTYGLFGRPRDQLALSFQHIVVSHYLADGLDNGATNNCTGGLAKLLGTGPLICARHALNTYSLTYTAAIIPGVSATMGAQYIDHPAIVWSPYMTSIANGGKGFGTTAATTAPYSSLNKYNINHGLNFVASLYVVF